MKVIIIPVVVWVILALGGVVSMIMTVQSMIKMLGPLGWVVLIGGIILGLILLFLLGEKLIAFIRYLENRKQS
jgi:hypothetical protein